MVKDDKAHTKHARGSAEEGAPADAHASGFDRDRLKQEVATFKLLCQGRDGKLCLFEDADGHYTAVRTDRLA